jgi:excisionase family DNA binding protein
MAQELHSVREVCRMLKVSRSTLWRWVASGRFPPPLRLSGQTRRWTWKQVADFLITGECVSGSSAFFR